MTVLVKASELDGSVSFSEAIDAVEAGFRSWAADRSLAAVRQRVRAPSGARLSVHQAAAPDAGSIGVAIQCELIKIDSEQHQRHVATGHQVRVVYDVETSDLEAILIGDIRSREFPETHAIFGVPTAAGSAVGTKMLAREDATEVGVLGAGTHGRYHLAALCAVRDIQRARVYSRTVENREAFAREASEALGIEVVAVDTAEQAVRDVDIVMCTTSSNVPVLDGSWLAPGTHVTSIVWSDKGLLKTGAIRKKRRELDDETLRRAGVIGTTSLQQFEHDEGADIFDGLQEGVFAREVLVDLGQLLLGEHPGRTSDDEITVYKNSAFYGTADQALTRLLLDKAKQLGVGQALDLVDTTLVNR